MTIDADPPTTGGFQVLGEPFRVEARTMAGIPITHFQKPFMLVVHLTPTDLQGKHPEDLVIHYFDPTQAEWIAIPSTVDTTAQTVTATLDHLTQFALLISEEQRIYLPFMRR